MKQARLEEAVFVPRGFGAPEVAGLSTIGLLASGWVLAVILLQPERASLAWVMFFAAGMAVAAGSFAAYRAFKRTLPEHYRIRIDEHRMVLERHKARDPVELPHRAIHRLRYGSRKARSTLFAQKRDSQHTLVEIQTVGQAKPLRLVCLNTQVTDLDDQMERVAQANPEAQLDMIIDLRSD